jgi:hypothetical protein
MTKKCVYCQQDIADESHKQQQRDEPHDSDIKMGELPTFDLWDKDHMLTQGEFAAAFNGTTLTYEGLMYTFYMRLWKAKVKD